MGLIHVIRGQIFWLRLLPLVLGASISVLSATSAAQTPSASEAGAQAVLKKPFSISSSAFGNGKAMPLAHTCLSRTGARKPGSGKSPPMVWRNLPNSAKSLAVLMYNGATKEVYWSAVISPKSPYWKLGMPQGIPPRDAIGAGLFQDRNSFGVRGYSGPCPDNNEREQVKIEGFALKSSKLGSYGKNADQILKALSANAVSRSSYSGLAQGTGGGDGPTATPTPTPTRTPTPTPTPTPTSTNTPQPTHLTFVNPTVVPLSETSVRVDWEAPSTGTVNSYAVKLSQGSTPLQSTTAAGSAVSATVTGITPGSTFTTAVEAIMAGTGSDPGENSRTSFGWTPYGSVNTDSVNDISWNVWKPNGIDAAVFSDNFSVVWSFYYNPDMTVVFRKVPSGKEFPEYVFNSRMINAYNSEWYGYDDITSLWTNGVDKFLASTVRGKMYLWDYLPTTPDQVLASRRIGQGATGRSGFQPFGGFWPPQSVTHTAGCFDSTNNKFYASERARNRVLVFNGWPSSSTQDADFVLGQPDFETFTANTGGIGAGTLYGPTNISCAGGKLAVTDTFNNRTLVWTSPIAASGQAADVIYGQSDATSGGVHGAGGMSSGGMSGPTGVLLVPKAAGGHALVVVDFDNKRLLEWETVPSPTGSAQFGGAYDRVYGQPDRTSNGTNTGGRSASSLACPSQLSHERDSSGGIKPDVFWATDGCYWTTHNGRVLKYARGTTAASGLFGALDFTSEAPSGFDVGPDRAFFWYSNFINGGRMSCLGKEGTFYLGGYVWRSAPPDGVTPSDFQGGRCHETSVGGMTWISKGTSVWGLNVPTVGELPNTPENPDLLLGRKLADGTDNGAVPDTYEYKIDGSAYLTPLGTKLLALDGHRVVGWETTSIASHAAIDIALGQPTKLTNAANSGGRSAATLSSPSSMVVHDGKIIVADTGNHRVLIWNGLPGATGGAADVVLGQPDATSGATGTGLGEMNNPKGAAVLNGKLLVADWSNYRILIWNTIPTVTATPADRYIDMRDLTFTMPSWINPDALKPMWIGTYGGRAYIEQFGRILVVPDIF